MVQTMTLQATVKVRSRQSRDIVSQRDIYIIQRKTSDLSEIADHLLLGFGQNRRALLLRSAFPIFDTICILPSQDNIEVDMIELC